MNIVTESIKVKVADEATQAILRSIINNFLRMNERKGINPWIKNIQLTVDGKTIIIQDMDIQDNIDYSKPLFLEDSDLIILLKSDDIRVFELTLDYKANFYMGEKYGFEFFRSLFENNEKSILTNLEYKVIDYDADIQTINAYRSLDGELINVDESSRITIEPEKIASVIPDISNWYCPNFEVYVFSDYYCEGKEFEEDDLQKLIKYGVEYFNKYGIEDGYQSIERIEDHDTAEDFDFPSRIRVTSQGFIDLCKDVSKIASFAEERGYRMDQGGIGVFFPDGKIQQYTYIDVLIEESFNEFAIVSF